MFLQEYCPLSSPRRVHVRLHENFQGHQTYSVQDAFRVKIFQSTENLTSERFRNFFIELAMLPQATSDGATRNVLQETKQKSGVNIGNKRWPDGNLHAEESRCFFKS